MTGLAKQHTARDSSPQEFSVNEAAKRHLLLASDRFDQSFELAEILSSVSEVHTIPTSEIPEVPADHLEIGRAHV